MIVLIKPMTAHRIIKIKGSKTRPLAPGLVQNLCAPKRLLAQTPGTPRFKGLGLRDIPGCAASSEDRVDFGSFGVLGASRWTYPAVNDVSRSKLS